MKEILDRMIKLRENLDTVIKSIENKLEYTEEDKIIAFFVLEIAQKELNDSQATIYTLYDQKCLEWLNKDAL